MESEYENHEAFSPNRAANFRFTSRCKSGDKWPNSRRIKVLVSVTNRCSRSTEGTRNPVAAKSFWRESSTMSVVVTDVGTWLLIKATTTCR